MYKIYKSILYLCVLDWTRSDYSHSLCEKFPKQSTMSFRIRKTNYARSKRSFIGKSRDEPLLYGLTVANCRSHPSLSISRREPVFPPLRLNPHTLMSRVFESSERKSQSTERGRNGCGWTGKDTEWPKRRETGERDIYESQVGENVVNGEKTNKR